jgi:hypothetical protein
MPSGNYKFGMHIEDSEKRAQGHEHDNPAIPTELAECQARLVERDADARKYQSEAARLRTRNNELTKQVNRFAKMDARLKMAKKRDDSKEKAAAMAEYEKERLQDKAQRKVRKPKKK